MILDLGLKLTSTSVSFSPTLSFAKLARVPLTVNHMATTLPSTTFPSETTEFTLNLTLPAKYNLRAL